MNDSSSHRILFGGKVAPILVHGKRGAAFRRLLKKLRVVKDHVWPEQFGGYSEELGMKQSPEPGRRIVLNVVRVKHGRIGTDPLHLWTGPTGIDIFVRRHNLSYDSVELTFKHFNLGRREDAAGEIVAMLLEVLGRLGQLTSSYS